MKPKLLTMTLSGKGGFELETPDLLTQLNSRVKYINESFWVKHSIKKIRMIVYMYKYASLQQSVLNMDTVSYIY